jgi:hypothetical protein
MLWRTPKTSKRQIRTTTIIITTTTKGGKEITFPNRGTDKRAKMGASGLKVP